MARWKKLTALSIEHTEVKQSESMRLNKAQIIHKCVHVYMYTLLVHEHHMMQETQAVPVTPPLYAGFFFFAMSTITVVRLISSGTVSTLFQ